MRILFVNKHIGVVGGVEAYIHALARHLSSRGCVPAIMHADEWMPSAFKASFCVPDIWQNELRVSARAQDAIEKIVASFDPDLIFIHNLDNGKAISVLSGKRKTVMFVHGYKAVDPDGKMLLHDPLEANRAPLSPACFLRAYTRNSMPRHPVKAFRSYSRARNALDSIRALERVVVASGHMKMILCVNGVDHRKISVIPYFADDQEDLSAGTDPGRILFSGRIAEGKGLDILLEVLGLVKEDFLLDISGDGPERELCVSKAERTGVMDRTEFLGWLSGRELYSAYERCAFLIMPSVWPEPFGISGIEAASHGKPAVAFNVGGISDWLIDGKTGYLVDPYDKQRLAERISELIRYPEKTREMGRMARQRALKKYAPARHIDKLMDVLRWGKQV